MYFHCCFIFLCLVVVYHKRNIKTDCGDEKEDFSTISDRQTTRSSSFYFGLLIILLHSYLIFSTKAFIEGFWQPASKHSKKRGVNAVRTKAGSSAFKPDSSGFAITCFTSFNISALRFCDAFRSLGYPFPLLEPKARSKIVSRF